MYFTLGVLISLLVLFFFFLRGLLLLAEIVSGVCIALFGLVMVDSMFHAFFVSPVIYLFLG